MRGEVAAQRLDEGGPRRFQARTEIGELFGVGLSVVQRVENPPPGGAEEVSDQPRDLQVGVVEGLLDALGVLRDRAHSCLRVRVKSRRC